MNWKMAKDKAGVWHIMLYHSVPSNGQEIRQSLCKKITAPHAQKFNEYVTNPVCAGCVKEVLEREQ